MSARRRATTSCVPAAARSLVLERVIPASPVRLTRAAAQRRVALSMGWSVDGRPRCRSLLDAPVDLLTRQIQYSEWSDWRHHRASRVYKRCWVRRAGGRPAGRRQHPRGPALLLTTSRFADSGPRPAVDPLRCDRGTQSAGPPLWIAGCPMKVSWVSVTVGSASDSRVARSVASSL